MTARLRAIFGSYPEIFFLHGGIPGAVLCAIMLLSPNVALAGIIGVLAAYAFARLVHMQDEFAASGAHAYNPLLVGLALGYMYRLTPLAVCLVIAAGLLTFVVTALLAHVFQTHLKLPVLSLPFVAVSAIVYLAAPRYAGALPPAAPAAMLTAYDPEWPQWAAGYFKSFSAVLFAPSVVVGIVFSLVVLYCSRILFLLSVMGYFVGTAFRALLLGSASYAFQDLSSFNFILIAMALGGVFLVPSLRSYLLALVAVAASTLVLDAVAVLDSYAGIRAFLLPFNVVTLGVVYVLGIARSPLLAWSPGRSPEETLENHLADRLRYRGQQHTLFLPFAGKWMVWQGFSGKWTHKGAGRFAYDFVIADDAGRTCTGDGTRLEDFYAFRKPVLAPVRGWVVKVVDTEADNPPASVDEHRPLGNLVIVRDARGFFVKLCHLAAGTIRVKEGEWVERGQILGLCGNSGYSPQPHIHVHVQASDSGAAPSLPFSFVSYVNGTEYCSNDTPAERQQVEPLYPDKRLEALTSFVLDEGYEFEVRRLPHSPPCKGGDKGGVIGRLAMKARMAADGTFYFESERGKLYFGRHEGTFYFYRADGDDEWLRLLFLAMPRLPLACREQLTWRDYVPVGLATRGAKRALARFVSSFYPNLARIGVTQSFVGRDRVQATIESQLLNVHRTAEVELDEKKGFASIRVDDIELIRLNGTATSKERSSTS